ncbi:hypothetical protein [Rhodopila sp.]|uniref:hypothetical protein n=1 Tax=Rhodopila sp. TaxID=2480087 RepID=UPI003D0A9ACA
MTRPRTSRALAAAVVLVVETNLAAAVSQAAVPAASSPALPGSTAVWSLTHSGYGRVVIETKGRTEYQVRQDGNHVLVRFADGIVLGRPPASPPNVVDIVTDGSTLELTLRRGARVHAMRAYGRVIIDVMGGWAGPRAGEHPALSMASSPELGGRSAGGSAAAANAAAVGRTPVAAGPAATGLAGSSLASRTGAPSAGPGALGLAASGLAASGPAGLGQAAAGQTGPLQIASGQTTSGQRAAWHAVPGQTVPSRTASGQAASGQAASGQSNADPNVVQTTEPLSPGRDVMPESDGPLSLLARRVRLPKEMDGTGLLIPFDATTAAAAFRGGDTAYVVFDERRPVDMSALRGDPAFGAASVQLLPNGTLVRIPLAHGQSIALTQLPYGWRVAALNGEAKQQPIFATFTGGHLDLAAEQPGDVVSLADPDTGATLLVGTQHRPGQAISNIRRGSEFVLRPTTQGVAVEALADAVVLRQTPTGFSLTGGPNGLLLSPQSSATDALMGAALLTRRLNLSTIPTEALRRLARDQLNDAAAAAPLARGPKRHLAAQSLLSLGMAAEAESLLHLAAEQDPKEASSADTEALTAIAAVLAGRPQDADGLNDPRLDGTDEISLWRAIRQAMADDGSPGAAAVLAATAPLVFQYPRVIQDHILPLILETMIKGGQLDPAVRLLDQRKDDPKLEFARAMLRQAEGDTDQALSMLDALSNGHDQFDRARAAVRAVELRLSTGKLDKAAAADALDKLLYAWRGDGRELALRERVAELRGQTGQWRTALAMLRQAEADFPDQAAPVHQRLREMFAAMVRAEGEQQLPAIDFVASVDENADLLPGPGEDETVQKLLADRLEALDLPERAKPVLEKLLHSAKTDVAKARFGLSLARLDARDGNNAGVKADLDASEADGLAPDLAEQRTIVRAGSVAGLGNPSAAAAMLAGLRSGPATQARAEILENASDWAGAEQAWSDNLGLTVPDSGMLNEAQTRTVLRLATASARAGDDAELAKLRGHYGNRIGPGPLADMFRLLIAEPIKTTADIKRSQREVSLAASLPAGLKALRGDPQPR